MGELGNLLLKADFCASGVMFPANCRYYAEHGHSRIVCIEIPPAEWSINYQSKNPECDTCNDDLYDCYDNCPHGGRHFNAEYYLTMPRLLFTFKVSNIMGRQFVVNKSYVHALRKPLESEEDMLCIAPLPNVNVRDGGICWGEVQLPPVKTLVGLGSLPGMFMGNNFNSDLFRDPTTKYRPTESFMAVGNLTSFFTQWAINKSFPLEALLDSKKFSDFVANL